MKYIKILPGLIICALAVSAGRAQTSNPTNSQSANLSFEERLNKRVKHFDSSGRTLIANVLDLAYANNLPIAFEYLDRDAATRSLSVVLHDEPVREIITSLIQQAPQYRVSFTGGLVSIYSPSARDNPSNLLNKNIKDFSVTNVDTRNADFALFCAISRDLNPASACVGSVATGQWGEFKMSVHMENAKVYEILDAIVARNGKAIWTVMVAPNNLSKTPIVDLWHIYPLDPPFKDAVVEKLAGVLLETTTVRFNMEKTLGATSPPGAGVVK